MALQMLHLDESIIGRSLGELRPLSPVFERMSAAEFKCSELKLTVSVQGRCYELETAPMIPDGHKQPVGWLAITRDFTERKRAEEQLHELYNQEAALRQELEAEIKKRIDFSRALVHELKTPLTPIIASIDTLADGLTEEPWVSLARNIERSAERLGERVDELLDIARSEAGVLGVELKRLNPLKLFRQVADEMNELASRQSQSLTTDFPLSLPLIMADESRLRQVLQNLLNNAFKYTPEGTKIVLSAGVKNGFLVVEVHDTGPGMPEEMQDRIFDLYSRREDDRQRLSGLGIGLALCKNIVELHGGRIWVDSEQGEGSTFSFSLPISED
jgi:signal transduction histidine kinase